MALLSPKITILTTNLYVPRRVSCVHPFLQNAKVAFSGEGDHCINTKPAEKFQQAFVLRPRQGATVCTHYCLLGGVWLVANPF